MGTCSREAIPCIKYIRVNVAPLFNMYYFVVDKVDICLKMRNEMNSCCGTLDIQFSGLDMSSMMQMCSSVNGLNLSNHQQSLHNGVVGKK